MFNSDYFSNNLPGFQGVPNNGSNQRSNPHQPAVFQARITRTESAKSIGFTLADPAIIKFQFMKPPRKAAMPVNRPLEDTMPLRGVRSPQGVVRRI